MAGLIKQNIRPESVLLFPRETHAGSGGGSSSNSPSATSPFITPWIYKSPVEVARVYMRWLESCDPIFPRLVFEVTNTQHLRSVRQAKPISATFSPADTVTFGFSHDQYTHILFHAINFLLLRR